MRGSVSSFRLSVLIALTGYILLADPAWTQTRPPTKAAPAPKAAPEPPPKAADPVRTSSQLKRESVEGAVTAPLRDLNMVKTDIPEVLLAAVEDPYAKPPPRWRCPQLNALIRPLDEALGPDLDRAPPEDDRLVDKGRSTALGAAADLASGAIPFRGVVRRITGAEGHDNRVQAAIIAGHVRRAYLKGLGEARACPAPATPSAERRLAAQKAAQLAAQASQPAAPASKAGPTPKYPVRATPAAPQTKTGTPATAPRKSRP